MTKIEWAEKSINPIVGCTKKGRGCNNCYAEKMAARLKGMYRTGNAPHLQKYNEVVTFDGRWNGFTYFDASALHEVINRKKPTMYLVNSMGDTFHESVKDKDLDKMFDVFYEHPQHTFQILTKRPVRMRDYFEGRNPGPNIWLGVTVEYQAVHDIRIQYLRETNAAVKFLSCEPLLCPISIDLEEIDWVIIGCESTINGRAGRFQAEFCEAAFDIVKQCKQQGVPVFVKQIPIDGKVVKDIDKFHSWLRVREYPKTKDSEG